MTPRAALDARAYIPLTRANTHKHAHTYTGLLGAGRAHESTAICLSAPQVYVGGQSDQNARAQFTMWALFPTNLLISQVGASGGLGVRVEIVLVQIHSAVAPQDVTIWSDYALGACTIARKIVRASRNSHAHPCTHACTLESHTLPVI